MRKDLQQCRQLSLLFVTLLVGSNLLLEESLLLLEKRPPLSNKVLAYNT